MTDTFYLAARFSRRTEMIRASSKLQEELNWKPNCSWVYGGESGLTRSDIAELDLKEVRSSDIIVLFSYPRGDLKSGGGRFIEFGYALALGKKCLVVGSYENVFCHHPSVKVYPSLDDLVSDQEEH